MSEFRFKRFSIDNTASALKVGTDSVLLGSLMTVDGGMRRLLDIGTGTGVVAVMAAQRLSDALAGEGVHVAGICQSADRTTGRDRATESAASTPTITAIDIDAPSAEEAARNFSNSPWAGWLAAQNCALENFTPDRPYDLIFSNPPFFDESLRNPDPRESRARHTESLSYREVLAFARENLSEHGRVSMILPSEAETAVRRSAAGFDLNLDRIVRIRTTQRKNPRRIVVEFTRQRNVLREEELTMQDGNEFTEAYRHTAGPFLLYL